MEMTANERAIALNIVNQFMKMGFSEEYHRPQNWSMYEWFDKNNLHKSGYVYASGATKAVFFADTLKNWVLKVALPDIDVAERDYCRLEYDNYVEAKKAGLSHYFATTEFIAEVGGVRFYAQEKVYVDEEVDGFVYDTLKQEYERDGSNYDPDGLWDEIDSMDGYSKVMYVYDDSALGDFIDRFHINDLHGGNFGRRSDGEFVMIDFSGYGAHVWR